MAFILFRALSAFLFLSLTANAQWPQAAGPHANFIAPSASAPTDFRGSDGHNIRWRVPMPSTGQSSPVVANGRVFVTSHEELTEDSETGSLIAGMCSDAATGMNVGGRIACYDFEGTLQWEKDWVPLGRHHARAHQPFIHDGAVVVMRCPRQDLAAEATSKPGAAKLGRGREIWTHLMAYDLQSGALSWQAEAGTSVHCVSMLGKTKAGVPAVLTGRGGGHKPPEEPYGLSLVSVLDGSTIWERAVPKYAAAQVATWSPHGIAALAGRDHLILDPANGNIKATRSLQTPDLVWNFDTDAKRYVRTTDTQWKLKKPTTYYTNIIVGDYHYYRTFDAAHIARIHLPSGRHEALQVPVQVVHHKDGTTTKHWQKSLPNDLRTAKGFLATSDKRNGGSGWGHCSAATPIVLGEHLYFPSMVGMVYVLRWNDKELSPDSLVSISDLGPAQKTWCLAGLAHADGKLYARTMKELLCIGPAKTAE